MEKIKYRTRKRLYIQEKALLSKICQKIPRQVIDWVRKRSTPHLSQISLRNCVIEVSCDSIIVDMEIYRNEKKEIENAILKKYLKDE